MFQICIRFIWNNFKKDDIVEKIDFGKRSTRADFAFCWIFARDCTPYSGYDDQLGIDKVNLVLAQLRFDGCIGACGGMVESDDNSLEEAVQREVLEEIGYTVDLTHLKPLLSLRLPSGSHCHSYSYEVDYNELQSIRDGAYRGIHFNPECAGVNLLHISRYTKGYGNECGYNVLLEQHWSGTSKEEFMYLVETENLLISYLKE